jgi:biopolymer transport protein ExbB
MVVFIDMMNAIQEFLDTGGWVLEIIAWVILVMWLLIFERLIFVFSQYRTFKYELRDIWYKRPEQKSWNALQIRQALISRGKEALNRNLALINSLVVLCPLLGLMGTVTGMIEVFDVMAMSGSGNTRSMASGVSRATIPTMAGMVGSLSGVFAVTWLQRNAKKETELLEDRMPIDH